MKGINKKISCILSVVMAFSAVSPLSVRADPPAFISDKSESSVEKAAEILINSRRDSYDPYGISPVSLDSYPESFDLRSADLDGSGTEKNYVTPVKFQNPLNNCWGFAAIAAAETSILSELGLSYEEYKEKYDKDMDLSEHHLSWFAFTPLPDGNSMLQDGEGLYVADTDEYSAKRMDIGGNSLTAASVFSSGIGPVYEESCPYHGKNGIIGAYRNTETGELYLTPKEDGTYEPVYYSADDDWSVDENLRFLQEYALEESFILPSPAQFVPDGDMGTYRYVYNQSYADGIKEQLMKGRVVQISYNADNKFINSNTWAHYTPLSANEDSEKGVSADHSVVIVGWDDNFPKENFLEENGLPPENGAWIVKNSWGSPDGTFPNKSDWGDKGYFYLSYYDHCISYPEALDFDTTTDVNDRDSYYYSFKYDYLPASYYNKYNITDEPTYMANIFATDKNMTIRTLTFQTETPGTQTSFEVYKLNETSEDPTDGELLASAKKEYPYGGYHSVDLEEPVFIPANTVFSVVVTNRTSDGKYEIVSDLNDSELSIKQYVVRLRETPPVYYAKAVVNTGESYIGNTVDGSVSWNDWKDVTDKSKEISMSLLNKIGYLGQLEKAERSREEFINALDEYADAHPDFDPDSFNEYDIPEELEALYSRWDADIREINRLEEMIINREFEGMGLTDAEIADMGEGALHERDNFPISVIADPVEAVDYTLYYDGETGRFYKEYETGVPSSPVEEDIPGAVCDGYKLTITSDFRFITTREDGLHIGKNVELYVPEGEQPTIQSGIEGTEGIDYSNSLAADDGCILNIDGVLEINSPDTVNTSTCAINGLGDLVIKGNGTLIAKGGDNVSDESAEAAETTSIGICSTGNLDVSIANLIAQSGNSCSESYGIVAGTYENGIFTISGGSHVTVRGGSGATMESIGCLVSSIDISGNSELTVLGGNSGILFYNDIPESRKICLSEGSVIDATGEEKGSFGLYYLGEPVLAEMDEDCTFTVRGNSCAAALSELIGVLAFSDGTAVKFDKDRKTYVDASGKYVKEISFRPDNGSSEETTDITEETSDTTEKPTTDTTEEISDQTESATSEQPTSEKTEQTTAVRENVARPSSSGGHGGKVAVPSKAATSDKKDSVVENTAAKDSTTKEKEPNSADKGDVLPNEVRITIGSNIISADGKEYTVDAAAYIQPESSSTLIPLRFAAIAISGGDVESADTSSSVSWDALSKTASVKTNNAVIKFTAGSNIMYINDKPIPMENGVKAEIKDGRMYIPFRALGTALGADVDWDGTTRTAVYRIK